MDLFVYSSGIQQFFESVPTDAISFQHYTPKIVRVMCIVYNPHKKLIKLHPT